MLEHQEFDTQLNFRAASAYWFKPMNTIACVVELLLFAYKVGRSESLTPDPHLADASAHSSVGHIECSGVIIVVLLNEVMAAA